MRRHLRIDDRDGAELAAGLPVVATVPHVSPEPGLVLSVIRNVEGPAARAVRTLASAVGAGGQEQLILITSPARGDGRSTLAVALALTLADAGVRTLLLDADLHGPAVDLITGLEGTAGLTTLLVGRAVLDDVVQPWQAPALDVLTSGERPPNPGDLLESNAVLSLGRELRERYDAVVVDAPSVPGLGASIVGLATTTLVALRVGHTRRKDLHVAAQTLKRVEAPGRGLVLLGEHPHRPASARRVSWLADKPGRGRG